MAFREIALDTSDGETSAFDLRVVLEGVDYTLALDWLDRYGLWVLSVTRSSDGSMVCSARAALPGRAALSRRSDIYGPSGLLFWAGSVPSRTTLGSALKLYYAEASELADVAALGA